MRNCLLRDIDRRHVDETSQQFYRPHPFAGEKERQTALQKRGQAPLNKKAPFHHEAVSVCKENQ